MMLGFKKQFETYVEEGSKRHSIRARGGRRWKPGVVADCFVNPRQKTMRCLGRWTVTKVEEIRIRLVVRGKVLLEIAVAGEVLSHDEANALAWRDGFRGNGREGALEQMAGFWRKNHGLEVFEGDLIHWDYDRPVGSPAERKQTAGRPGRPRKVAA
jgi:hypothetical protein